MNYRTLFFIGLTYCLTLSGIIASNSSSGPPFGEGRNTDEDDAELKEYTWVEIREHNKEDDLWIVLRGRVYNVTNFQIDHPGGPDVLQDVGGQDCSEEFENVLHTEKARKMAKKYLIGKVKKGEKGAGLGDLFEDIDNGNIEEDDEGWGGFFGQVQNKIQGSNLRLGWLGFFGFLLGGYWWVIPFPKKSTPKPLAKAPKKGEKSATKKQGTPPESPKIERPQ